MHDPYPSTYPASSTSSLPSTNSLSRASSVHSTASVQAVPFRTPVRGPVTPLTRAGSGSYFNAYNPGSSAMSRKGSNGGTGKLEPPIMENGLTNWSAVGGAVAAAEAGLTRTESKESNSTATSTPGKGKSVKDFKFGEILGEGSYSTVMQISDTLPPHKHYALKILDKEHIKREKKTKYVLIERDTLKSLDGHPGVVRLYWTFQDTRSLYYVLELAENGELLKWIKKVGSFSLPSARFYAAQILSAVEWMHAKNVIHRDIKPENILLDSLMRVKITDFGTAKLLTPDGGAATGEEAPNGKRTRSFVGTPEYVSPEILNEGEGSSFASDYWAFGCVLFQIIAGRPPFQARTEYLMFQKIINLEYEFPEEFPADGKDLIKKLLVIDPKKRLGIEEIKSHPFFTSDPAIDFSTIWKMDPPAIETGLVGPKEPEVGEFVLDEDDVDGDDGLESFEGSEEETGAKPPVMGGTSPRAELVTKWTGVFLPQETIVLTSSILDRTGFLTKKRTLILTDWPRLVCIKESLDKVSIKSEVGFGQGGGGGATLRFLKAGAEGDRQFWVKTSQRTFKYEDPSGSCGRWVKELLDASERSDGSVRR
ncbi:hypothetical protein MNV49_000139 [Pseudohyphozyma bogoriensis]|nr:hypothetical protein MNV49_000139 [Pseudohyphozyma bogoriensis]